jgi:hypothetical protein
VEYAPDALLERRGVHERATIITEDDRGKRHRYEVRTDDGTVLDERLEYRGSNPPYGVGDTLTIVHDPEGVVPMEEAAEVDSAGMRASLIAGASGWTLIAWYAVRRGHVRRQQGRTLRDISF